MKTVIISNQNSPCRCGPTPLHQLPLPRCGPLPPGHWGFHLGWLRARWCLPPIELLSLSLTHPPMNWSSCRCSSCALPGCEVTLAPPSSPSSHQPQGLQCSLPNLTPCPALHETCPHEVSAECLPGSAEHRPHSQDPHKPGPTPPGGTPLLIPAPPRAPPPNTPQLTCLSHSSPHPAHGPATVP